MTRMTTTDMYKPDMNRSNGTTTETSHMTRMTTTDMYKPDMNRSNFSTTTETSHMTRMTTTDMYKPDMNRSNGTTTETTSTTMMMTGVPGLEGCMSLSVSDPLLFAGSSDAVEALERALSRAAGGGMMLKDAFVWASIVPGQTCDSGGMPSTTTSGYRRLQDSVKVTMWFSSLAMQAQKLLFKRLKIARKPSTTSPWTKWTNWPARRYPNFHLWQFSQSMWPALPLFNSLLCLGLAWTAAISALLLKPATWPEWPPQTCTSRIWTAAISALPLKPATWPGWPLQTCTSQTWTGAMAPPPKPPAPPWWWRVCPLGRFAWAYPFQTRFVCRFFRCCWSVGTCIV